MEIEEFVELVYLPWHYDSVKYPHKFNSQGNSQGRNIQGLHHGFDMGGIGTLGGRRGHDIPHIPPISVSPRISATSFCENACQRFLMLKKTKKSPNIGEDYPPRLHNWEGHVPRVPPRGAAYGNIAIFCQHPIKVSVDSKIKWPSNGQSVKGWDLFNWRNWFRRN